MKVLDAPPSAPLLEADAPVFCYHCGNDCGGTPISDGDKDFCCSGCATVYQLLHDNGLSDFYAIGAGQGSRPTEQGKYAWLDDPKVAERLLDYQDEQLAKATFHLPDMHCAACIWLLEHLFRIQPGISRSEVDFPRREISLNYDPSALHLRQVVELLDVLGYPPKLTLADAEETHQRKYDRKRWYALGIAGFCFGNIMLLSFPEYLGVQDPRLTVLFQWLNLALSIPVLHSARGWFRSAWNGLRHRDINMDVPIAIGITVLFGRSLFDIISGAGPGYFDSLAGLVFFLLIGRIYQDKTYHLLSFDRDYRSYFPISVTRLQPDQTEEQVQIRELAAGDRLLIRNGELIPADGYLVEGPARLDYSFVTGESDPVEIETGAKIYAGGRLVGAPVEVVLEKEVAQAHLTKLWNHEAFRKQKDAEVAGISNRVARAFTPTIVLTAIGAGIYWAFVDSTMIWNVVTSVLIVACPCALALSTPFTLGHIVRVFGKRGFFLKSHATVERLAKLDALVFDKTGTITNTQASGVQWEGDALTETDQAAVKAVLRASVHPLSRRIYDALDVVPAPDLVGFEEVKGKGLSAQVNGVPVQLGQRTWVGAAGEAANGVSEVWVRINGVVKGRYTVLQTVRPGIGEAMKGLENGYALALLSGDQEYARSGLGALLPDSAPQLYRQSPEAKLHYIRDLQDQDHVVAMVGDGLNDAGALRQSDVGIAVTDELAAFTPASDGILEGRALRFLPQFLRLSQQGMQLIYISFGISFLYNLVGLWFAVNGLLSPLVAAILMPLSSVSVVVFTTLGVSWLAHRSFSSTPSNPAS